MREYDIVNGDKVEKYHVALLLNAGTSASPRWIQLAKATENTINLNSETEDKEFIVDKIPTTLLKQYKPSMNNPLTLFKGEEDYEFFWDKFYNLPTGDGASGEVLIVFMNEPTGNHKYKAWKSGATFVLDNLDPVNSQLTMAINFNGTPYRGEVTVTDGNPVFVSDEITEFGLTVTVTDGGTPAAEASVMVGGTLRVTGSDGKASFVVNDGETIAVGAWKGSKVKADVLECDSSEATLTLAIE